MKKYLKVLSFVLIILIFSSCGRYKESSKENSKDSSERTKFIEKIEDRYKSIYDDEERIVNNGCGMHVLHWAGGNISKYEVNEAFDSYYGAINFWRLDAKEDGKITLKYNYKFRDNEKYKLLLCTPDNKIVKIFENTSSNNNEVGDKTIEIKKGKNRIVSVGYNADAKVDISIKVDDNIEIEDMNKDKKW